MKEIESWQNGNWIPNSQSSIPIWDAHSFFGWAVFDAFRTYKHKFHLLDAHLDRFYRSAKLTAIPIELTKNQLIEKIAETVDHNKEFFRYDEYRMMVFASPGFFKIYDDIGIPKPSLTINVTTTSRYAKHIYPYVEKGVTGVVTTQRQIPNRFLDPKIKSCSRLHYGLADVEAGKYGTGHFPILLDEHGFLAESSGSNIGFIKENTLYLPNKHDNLRGCTMQFIESIAKDSGIDVKYGNWTPYDLVFSEGLIFTSAFFGILPAWKIIYKGVPYEIPGGFSVYTALVKGYSEKVGVDIIEQWRKWYVRSQG